MKKVYILLLFFLCFVAFWKSVLAVDAGELSQRISEYQKQIETLQNQEKTLNQQISLMDNQMKIAALKINQTEGQIGVLESEIATLSGKIIRLDSSLNYLSKVLLSRVVETYKEKKSSSWQLLFSSKSLSTFVANYRYLQTVQIHDRELLLSMEQTRTSYDEQKALKEKIQTELKKLQEQLVAQKKQLLTQSADKKKLLADTRGKESEYQRLLSQALSEQETILKLVQASVLKLSDGTKVEKGKEIALIGNSGYPCCSTGSHLHFMVTTGCQRDDKGFVKNCNPVNPADYLKNQSVDYDSDVVRMDFKGDWDWPVDNVRITQEYGMSYWARTGYYGGKPHNGVDMTGKSMIVKAPKEGIVYRQSTSCGGCNGKCCATVNFVALDHGGGVYSWYWHVK